MPKTIVEDNIDILVAGAGLGGTGAAFEARYWGKDKKIVIAEKANIDRSGAVAQGLYAINCYMGTRFGENNPEDHVRYARIDLMGMVREDLLFDMARHVDSAVHQFEEWGMPIMRNPKTGAFLREGRWQIMIHGESYKPLVAEAAKKSADKVFNRICVTHLLMDESKANRVAGAVGFNVRTGNYHVFKSKTVICGAGGASNIFKPRSVGEVAGRVWYGGPHLSNGGTPSPRRRFEGRPAAPNHPVAVPGRGHRQTGRHREHVPGRRAVHRPDGRGRADGRRGPHPGEPLWHRRRPDPVSRAGPRGHAETD